MKIQVRVALKNTLPSEPGMQPVSQAPAPVSVLLRDFDPKMMNYLRCLLNSQPFLRSEWETWDFFQELSSRYLLRVSAKRKVAPAPGNHETALLKRLAKHLFVDQLRRLRAKKRDIVRLQNLPQGAPEPVATADPSQLDRMVRLETLERVRRQLTEDEWEILRLHSEGHGWVEMAATLGRKPSAVRMQFNRLLARLAETVKL